MGLGCGVVSPFPRPGPFSSQDGVLEAVFG